MLKVGKINTLTIVKSLDFGVYLDGEDKGEILMPRRYVPEDAKVGDSIDAFIYLDSEDSFSRLVKRSMDGWLDKLDFGQRKRIINTIFGVLYDFLLFMSSASPVKNEYLFLEVFITSGRDKL